MNILVLYVLEVSGKVFENQVKISYTPLKLNTLAMSLSTIGPSAKIESTLSYRKGVGSKVR